MEDRQIEERLRQMNASEMPDLWNRIEKEVDQCMMEEKKDNRAKRTIGYVFERFLRGNTLKTAAALCAVCLVITGVFHGVGALGGAKGGGGGYSMDQAASEEAVAEEEYAEAPAEMPGNGMADTGSTADMKNVEEVVKSDRKLIRNIYMDLETMTLDSFVAMINAKTEALGGYVENSYYSGSTTYRDERRYASLTLRIPKEKTEEFLGAVSENSNILNQSEDVEDVTLTYVDIESHVKALRTEEETLLGLLEKAGNLEEILAIQNELTNIRYQLESYESQLKTYDNKIDYDTINLSIQEVAKNTPVEKQSMIERIKRGLADSFEYFTQGFEDVVVAIVIALPYILGVFVILSVLVWIVKHLFRKKK